MTGLRMYTTSTSNRELSAPASELLVVRMVRQSSRDNQGISSNPKTERIPPTVTRVGASFPFALSAFDIVYLRKPEPDVFG